MTLSPKCCCSTRRTLLAMCGGSPSCIHTTSLMTFRCCNSGIT
ncbi:unnamed protein product [Larinioides sclopetarius]|uniref:Uncharacterized protein n=1 Tax=Larinioides sclopetarius TaxID=280406 RepID=A0AAV2A9L6_9ARAC